MPAAWIAAGGAILGGVMSSSAAGDAADAQAAAAAKADATQRYMYDTTRADNADFMNNGRAANNRLAYLMGINPYGNGTAPNSSLLTRDQILAELRPQFTSQQAISTYGDGQTNDSGSANFTPWMPTGTRQNEVIDTAGLNAAVEARLAQQAQQQEQQQADAQKNALADPNYGLLARRFSAADLNADPVYQSGLQFGLDEGTKGINRQQAATGNLLSGATLKALTRYGNDYASTKANESYNRFNNDQTNIFNRYSGMAGSGQTANALVGSAGLTTAGNISQNELGVGNARAASAIGQAGAWNNALAGGYNNYQNNKLITAYTNKLNGGSSGNWWGNWNLPSGSSFSNGEE